jgi:tetratricopeptide (TPR) repeat protein
MEMVQMRMVSKMALALALGSAMVAAPAFAKKEDKAEKSTAGKPSPAVQTAALAAQKAVDAGDIATAQTHYAEAKAAMTTDDDKFTVGRVGYQIYQKNKDEALFAESLDLMLASGKASPVAQQQMYVAQGKIAYNQKNYAKALTAFQAAQAAGSTDPDLTPALVETLSLSGQTLQALNMLDDAIGKQIAANQPVPIDWYQRGLAIGYRSKANPADLPAINAKTLEISKKWVASDPQKRNWAAALQIYEEQYKLDTEARVDVLRLLRAADALASDADYREYADDVYLRFPNEAMVVLQEGASKGVVNLSGKNDASDVMGIVKGKVAADKASLPAADKSARTAANGRAAFSTADAYVSYGQYAQAVDLYKVALTKGGVDAGVVNLHMGWALALSGDAAGAKAAFGAVTGARKPIADFWLIHLDHPTIANAPAA